MQKNDVFKYSRQCFLLFQQRHNISTESKYSAKYIVRPMMSNSQKNDSYELVLLSESKTEWPL